MPERFGRFGVASGSLERKANGRIANEWHFARNLTGRDSNKRQLTVRRLAAIKLVFRFNGEASVSVGPAFGGFQRTESYTVVERPLKGCWMAAERNRPTLFDRGYDKVQAKVAGNKRIS